ncbi:hypothetical protein [Vibrio harveyi]|uniref:hypothetical protein n=1 Tax=Vibrio harveyi TaxID=669 RepID=UPI003BB80C66
MPIEQNLTHYAKRYAQKFSKFIKSPQLFTSLWTCHSSQKPLQERQRVTVVNVVKTLLSVMEAEHNAIGVCKPDSMEGITHKNLRTRYEKLIGEPITKGRWFRAIEQLKKAGYLKTKTAWIATLEDDEQIIRSIASKKFFTKKFFCDLALEQKQDIKKSRSEAIKARRSRGLSNIWKGYKLFNKAKHKVPKLTFDEPPPNAEFEIPL